MPIYPHTWPYPSWWTESYSSTYSTDVLNHFLHIYKLDHILTYRPNPTTVQIQHMAVYAYISTYLTISLLMNRNLQFHIFHRCVTIPTYLRAGPYPHTWTEFHRCTDSTDCQLCLYIHMLDHIPTDEHNLTVPHIPQMCNHSYISTSWTISSHMDRIPQLYRFNLWPIMLTYIPTKSYLRTGPYPYWPYTGHSSTYSTNV